MSRTKRDFFITWCSSLVLLPAHHIAPQLCDPNNKDLAAIGVEMRRRLIVTRNNVQRVTGSEDFSNGFQLLKVGYPASHYTTLH
jgi:hypothetical protein